MMTALHRDQEQQRTYEKIVVALDGSALAEAVIPYVLPLARAFNSEITLVCAYPLVEDTLAGEMALSGAGMGGLALEQIYEGDELVGKEDSDYLETVRQRLTQQGLRVQTTLPRMRAAPAIVAIANRENADLIAMTTHGRSGFTRALLGSVADAVLRAAPCPVLLIHPSQ